MAKKKPYTLMPMPLPNVRGRRGEYVDAIEDFAASGRESSVVMFEGREPDTVRRGLAYALNKSGRTDIRVSRQGDEVYLIRVR